MNLLGDIITYIRRIIKSPSNTQISDNLLIDYINRFWINDVDARIQLFDLKTKYQFQTEPGYDQYNMPLYSVQTEPGNQNISYYPVFQGFENPAYVNGIQVPLYTHKTDFFNVFPNIVQQMNAITTGDGSAGPYTLTFPIAPNNATPINTPFQYILRGHVDMGGIIAYSNGIGTLQDPPIVTTLDTSIPLANIYPGVYITSNGSDGSSIIVSDSGQFLQNNENYGLLMSQGNYPNGVSALPGVYSTVSNTINYLTGVAIVTFPSSIPSGVNISAQCNYFQCGLPRGILFNNNTLIFRVPPDRQYKVEIDAYLSPAAFLSTTTSVPFGYMSEYIARGAARKILADTGDIEQFQFYEPFFREQEMLVWKRAQRQNTATRNQTIYSSGFYFGTAGTYGGQAI